MAEHSAGDQASTGDKASFEGGVARGDGAGLLFRALRDASDKHEQIAAQEAEEEVMRREAAAADAVADAARLTYGQFTNRPEVTNRDVGVNNQIVLFVGINHSHANPPSAILC